MNERYFLLNIKCATPIKSNRNHFILLFSSFPFSLFLFHMDISWPFWRMLLWSASGQKCLLILFTVLISLCKHTAPKAHLACGTVLSVLLTPMSTVAWCGGPGAATVTSQPSGCVAHTAWHQGWRSKNDILSPNVGVWGWDRDWGPITFCTIAYTSTWVKITLVSNHSSRQSLLSPGRSSPPCCHNQSHQLSPEAHYIHGRLSPAFRSLWLKKSSHFGSVILRVAFIRSMFGCTICIDGIDMQPIPYWSSVGFHLFWT